MAAETTHGTAEPEGTPARRSADKPYACIYSILRDRWRAAEPAAPTPGREVPQPGRPELQASRLGQREQNVSPLVAAELMSHAEWQAVARFCRRLGGIPKTWPKGRATEAARDAVQQMATGTGSRPEEVRAALLSFCHDESPEAVCSQHPLCAECPVKEYCSYPGRHLTIKDLPSSERPRERLLQGGEDHLSDVELLAIIIRGGWGKETALDLAARLLSTYGSFRRLAQCTAGQLTHVDGIGPAKAAQIKAALAIARRYASEKMPPGTVVSGSERLFRYMREKLRGLKKEHFYALMLDTKHRIIREEQVAVGSLNESVVHPREVFKTAISESAARVIFVHNHPSGNPEPSSQDKRLTTRLCQAGELVGIPVLDHLIVGEETFFSFAEHGLLGRTGGGQA